VRRTDELIIPSSRTYATLVGFSGGRRIAACRGCQGRGAGPSRGCAKMAGTICLARPCRIPLRIENGH